MKSYLYEDEKNKIKVNITAGMEPNNKVWIGNIKIDTASVNMYKTVKCNKDNYLNVIWNINRDFDSHLYSKVPPEYKTAFYNFIQSTITFK